MMFSHATRRLFVLKYFVFATGAVGSIIDNRPATDGLFAAGRAALDRTLNKRHAPSLDHQGFGSDPPLDGNMILNELNLKTRNLMEGNVTNFPSLSPVPSAATLYPSTSFVPTSTTESPTSGTDSPTSGIEFRTKESKSPVSATYPPTSESNSPTRETYTPTLSPTTTSLPSSVPTITSSSLFFQAINILVLTDTHSWVQGHSRHKEKSLSANYGDVLSFYQRLKQQFSDITLRDVLADGNERRASRNRVTDKKASPDLYFVMNGDFVHGTFLGADPPKYLPGIIERMPYDVVTLGEHELVNKKTFDTLRQPGGLFDEWGDRLVTSNIRVNTTSSGSDESKIPDAPLGSNYKIVHGNQGKILFLGFLYNVGNISVITVENVQSVVEESWFLSLFPPDGHPDFDAIVILAHMDVQDELVTFLLTELRQLVGNQMVIQFITGHTHIRSFITLDKKAASFEAGRYLDTIGFASFDPVKGNFAHKFIDVNKESFAAALGMDINEYPTEDGKELTSYIERTREHAGANVIVGCAPQRYRMDGYLNETDSLLKLYLEQILPTTFLQKHKSGSSTYAKRKENVFIQSLENFVRYDLFEGVVTMDDVYSIVPEDDTIVQLSSHITGKNIMEVLEGWNNDNQMFLDNTTNVIGISTENPPKQGIKDGLEETLLPLQSDSSYQLFTLSKYFPIALRAMQDQDILKHTSSVGSDIFHGKRTMRSMWIDFVKSEWPYDSNDCQGLHDDTNNTAGPETPSGGKHVNVPANPTGRAPPKAGGLHSGSSAPLREKDSGLDFMGMIWISLAIAVVVFFAVKSRRRGYSSPDSVGEINNDLELQASSPPGYDDMGYSVPSLPSRSSIV